MLFDEKDLRVFDSPDSRTYFQEILQSYYSKNYRATIVLLYSFVIYDLFIKLQNMANEGDKKAKSKLSSINTMIADDEKYSKVENEIIDFFKNNCPLYFDRFIEDIEYLKNCRNKCAHLKVNDNTLYIPNDYHAKMLICSMYDHILSVKAPFIMDLFSFAQNDVVSYSASITKIPDSGIDDSVKEAITNKYLKRMTYDSLKKSYKTFTHLLFVVSDEECIENICGLYAFAYTMTDYITKNGYMPIMQDPAIHNEFSKISTNSLENCSTRRNALIGMMLASPMIMDTVRDNNAVFDYICRRVLLNPQGLKYYRSFYPRSSDSSYAYFMKNTDLQNPYYSETLFDAVKDSDDFNLPDFLLKLVENIPSFNGFDSADYFMDLFMSHLNELTIEDIEAIMNVYGNNIQCINRGRHLVDKREIQKHIDSRAESTKCDDDSTI